MSERTTLKLFVGRKSSGEPVYEEILADRLAANLFKIVATPGLVLGVAAGDTIEMNANGDGFSVVHRGGNVAIQLYGDSASIDEHLNELQGLTHAVDGRAPNLTILTVPVRVGFQRIEEALNGFCSRHPGVRWFYGNVYDSRDGTTPLNWWESS